MTEFNIKPSEVKQLYEIIEILERGGLDIEDIYKLIQRRTHPQMSIKNIKNIISAIKKLERNIIFNQKRRAKLS